MVPAGTPLQFERTSATVMSAFFVPQLGTQIYTMPGMTTHLNLLADHPGVYPGLSSHFNGDGFSDMRFVVQAVTATEFKSWVAHTRSAMPALDAAAYTQLARPSSHVDSQSYGSVDAMLFEHIQRIAAPLAAARPED
jgi:cytochrome o ubiquinol oxidase subunit 2